MDVEDTSSKAEKDDGGDIGAGVDDSKSQVAINITAQFVYERLTPSVATDLVMVSLVCFGFV